jgi:hypothetical protein
MWISAKGCVVLAVLTFGMASAQEPAAQGTLAERLQSLDQSAEAAREQVRQKLAKEIAAIDSELLIELKKLMDDSTRNADLDGALAIRDRIQEIEQAALDGVRTAEISESSSTKKLFAKLTKSYWIFPPSGSGFTFRSDGYMMPIDQAGDPRKKSMHRWSAVTDTHFVILYNGGPMNVIFCTLLPNGFIRTENYGGKDSHVGDVETKLLPLPKNK